VELANAMGDNSMLAMNATDSSSRVAAAMAER
jgi:hypothetical protein